MEHAPWLFVAGYLISGYLAFGYAYARWHALSVALPERSYTVDAFIIGACGYGALVTMFMLGHTSYARKYPWTGTRWLA